MEHIKAITTYYNGYKFRSRLEARWAVFFDAANIRYEYEPEGFKMQSGLCYLPDFYLPEENMYVEVKPQRKDSWKDIDRVCKFVGNGINTLLLLSNIPSPDACIWYFPVLYWHPVDLQVKIKWCPFVPSNNGAYLLRLMYDPTQEAEQLVPIFSGISESQAIMKANDMLTPKQDKSKELYEAFLDDDEKQLMVTIWGKARQARFEHGEKG